MFILCVALFCFIHWLSGASGYCLAMWSPCWGRGSCDLRRVLSILAGLLFLLVPLVDYVLWLWLVLDILYTILVSNSCNSFSGEVIDIFPILTQAVTLTMNHSKWQFGVETKKKYHGKWLQLLIHLAIMSTGPLGCHDNQLEMLKNICKLYTANR